MIGGVGNDTLVGGAGADTLQGGPGDDVLDGGQGVDALSGGAGNDRYFVDNAGDAVDETSAGAGGVDTVISALPEYTLGAGVENLEVAAGSRNRDGAGNALDNILVGNRGANRLSGLEGNDVLEGGDGRDVLDGGSGDDRMTGGNGDDRYLVDSLADIVLESSDRAGGTDTVVSLVADYALAANVENLEIAPGSGNLNGAGNELDNRLIGNAGDNQLSGLAGSDTLLGGDGDDTLDGGADGDLMRGGTGNDVYVVDSPGDGVDEAKNPSGGLDTVLSSIAFYALPAGVENLQLTGSAVYGTGNSLNNLLTGNNRDNQLAGRAGDDVLDGGAGNDHMAGGAGNDRYLVDSAGDVVDEAGSGGTDTVVSSLASYCIGANIENLELASGVEGLNGTGNALANLLVGNDGTNELSGLEGNDTILGLGGHDLLGGGAGDDVLDGGLGADSMSGGAGNDRYVVDDAGDIVDETSTGSGGTDTVVSSIAAYTLATEVENLVITAAAANLNGAGNALDNTLAGNDGANELSGLAGNDTIVGSGGNDTLHGGEGDDLLDGGTGIDVMSGGAGNDRYLVDDAADLADETVAGSGGTDTVVSSAVSFILGDDVENLEITAGSASLNGTGNALGNVITGNDGANRLSGAAGNDVIAGARGNDILSGGQGNDLVQGGEGNDSLDGGEGDDVLDGGPGKDVLQGGLGRDRLLGGRGDDIYVIDGRDILPDNVVTMQGNGFILTGDKTFTPANSALQAQAEDIDHDGAIDTVLLYYAFEEDWGLFFSTHAMDQGLVPGVYDDAMRYQFELDGHPGMDLFGNHRGSSVVSGAFTVIGADLEYVDFHPVVISLAIEFELHSEGEASEVIFGAVTVNYSGATLPDFVLEKKGEGNDTVEAAISYTLPWNVENLVLTGTGDIDGTGNGLDNVIVGNDGDNVLEGGVGNDTLTGGDGADTFLFAYPLLSTSFDAEASTGHVDAITDFESGVDSIELQSAFFSALFPLGGGALPASNLAIGPAAVESNDYLVYDPATGRLYYDPDGNGANQAFLFATLPAGTALEASDISLSAASEAQISELTGRPPFDGVPVLGTDGSDVLQGEEDAVEVLAGGPGNDTYIIADGVPAPPTVLLLEGNDIRILDGERYLTSYTGGTFVVLGFDNTQDGLVDALQVSYSDPAPLTPFWSLGFSTDQLGVNLMPGFYGNAVLYPFETAGHPGLVVGGEGRGANSATGNFTVFDAEFDYSNPAFPTVVRLSIAFEFHAEGSPLTVTGILNINEPADPITDQIFEASGEGVDTVQSAFTFDLPANVENLVLTGTNAADGTGNGLANVLTGNSAANRLTGGGGNDRFVFSTAPAAGNVDTITDFVHSSDRIVLDDDVFTAMTAGHLAAGVFASGSGVTAGLDATDRLAYNTSTGALYYDADGTGGSAAIKIAILEGAPIISAADIDIVT